MTKIYCDNKYCSWSSGGICQRKTIEMIKGVDKTGFGIRYCREKNVKNVKKQLMHPPNNHINFHQGPGQATPPADHEPGPSSFNTTGQANINQAQRGTGCKRKTWPYFWRQIMDINEEYLEIASALDQLDIEQLSIFTQWINEAAEKEEKSQNNS